MSKRELAKIKKMASILDAAETVLFSKSVQLATMDDVAQAANCSKATVYVYFPSKDDLILAVASKGNEICQEMMRSSAENFKTGADRVRAIGFNFFLFAAKHPDYYRLLSSFISMDVYEIKENVNKELLDIDQLLTENITLGIKDKTIKSGTDPKVVSKCLWFMANGLIQFIIAKGFLLEKYSGITIEKLLETCFLVLEESMAVKPQYRDLLAINPNLFKEIAVEFKG